MDEAKEVTSFKKIEKVIKSAKTLDQMEVAKKMVNKFFDMYGRSETYEDLYELMYDQRSKIYQKQAKKRLAMADSTKIEDKIDRYLNE